MASKELRDTVQDSVSASNDSLSDAAMVTIDDGSGPMLGEFLPDAAALEAAMNAAADASLRIYLVRQDAEAAAMIDEARAAGDALYAAKLKESTDAETTASLASDIVSSSPALNQTLPSELSPNSEVVYAGTPACSAVSTDLSASQAAPCKGCPEPWESNPKFSPCRKFMAEFCTLHGTDPRSRCCPPFATLSLLICQLAGMSLYGVKMDTTI